MPKCKHLDCSVTSSKRLQSDGYCEKHSLEMADQQYDIKAEVERLKAENASLRSIVKQSAEEIIKLNARVNGMSANINTANYERDALEQYNRLESWRIINAEEDPVEYDGEGNVIDNEDCDALAIKAAGLLGVTLDPKEIQRCHRIGKKRAPKMVKGKLVTPKPRQVIVKLKDYKTRMNIIIKKRNLQDKAKEKDVMKLSGAFLAEDLTPLRSKLLWYCKKQCGGKFESVHTRDGRINAKIAGTDKWVVISSPDDLFTHGINVDIDLMNRDLRKIQILKHVETPTVLSRITSLLSDNC